MKEATSKRVGRKDRALCGTSSPSGLAAPGAWRSDECLPLSSGFCGLVILTTDFLFIVYII